MPQYNEKYVKVENAIVVWDGITRPAQNPDGSPKYSLKVVIPPNSPDIPLVEAIAQQMLFESEFKGVLPAGGRMPVGTATAQEFNGMFPGYRVLNCNSNRMPDVYDENGALMDAMQYGPLIYGGQLVHVLVNTYAYNKAGNRGVAAGLAGFSIVQSANAPRQQFGDGGVDTSGAFAPGGMAAAPAATPQAAAVPPHAVAPSPAAVPPAAPVAPVAPQQSHHMLPGAPGAPAPAPAAPVERQFNVNGQVCTESALKAAGWTDTAIAALPAA